MSGQRPPNPARVRAILSAHTERVSARAEKRLRRRARTRRFAVVGLGVAGALVALGFAVRGSFMRAAPPRGTNSASTPVVPAKSKPKLGQIKGRPLPTTTTRRTRPKATPARRFVLTLTNTGASTWVEVRSASATGPLLYAGVFPAGARKSLHTAKPLWVRFAAAGNLAIALNGRPVRVPTGTYDGLFTSRGFKLLANG
jgi:Domain of unknown function (DUF4115)